jgi:6-phosphogluconolactonase
VYLLNELVATVTTLSLVATGEKSETISVYAIDPTSGALRLLKKYPTGKGSNWVEIVSFD